MTDRQVRADRVANGSRRQRDLAAVGASENPNISPKVAAYVAQHFPGEAHYAVAAALYHVRKGQGSEDPQLVRERMRQVGSLKEQLA